ncbi:MAG: hypothetical protein ACM3JB_12005 [Acidobacteriaceae bacterium]
MKPLNSRYRPWKNGSELTITRDYRNRLLAVLDVRPELRLQVLQFAACQASREFHLAACAALTAA